MGEALPYGTMMTPLRVRVGVRSLQDAIRRIRNGGHRDRRGHRRIEVRGRPPSHERSPPARRPRARIAFGRVARRLQRLQLGDRRPLRVDRQAGGRPAERRPNSTTLPFTRKSVTSMPGGSSARCSRRMNSPARPFDAPPASTVANRLTTSRCSPVRTRGGPAHACGAPPTLGAHPPTLLSCSEARSRWRPGPRCAEARSPGLTCSRSAGSSRVGAVGRRSRWRRGCRDRKTGRERKDHATPRRSWTRHGPRPCDGRRDLGPARHRSTRSASVDPRWHGGRWLASRVASRPRDARWVTSIRDRIRELHDAELAWFRAERPRTLEPLARAAAHMPNGTPMAWMASDNDQPVYVDRGEGASFTDVDGHRVRGLQRERPGDVLRSRAPGDRSRGPGTGRALDPVPAPDRRVGHRRGGARAPLPAARRIGSSPLSASQANTEAIRLARAGDRPRRGPAVRGPLPRALRGRARGPRGRTTGTRAARPLERRDGPGRITQFNDVEGLRTALGPDDVAIVLTEPALTNNIHFLPPEPGWRRQLRRATRERGTVLAFDETHTRRGPGWRDARLWGLEPDVVTIGKAVAGGIPMGAYGVSAALAGSSIHTKEVATGGTLFGNPLSAAAAIAALTEVLVPAAYERTTALGGILADRDRRGAARRAGLPLTSCRFGLAPGQWVRGPTRGREPTRTR